MHDTDAIRERVSLVDLMGRDGVQLRKTGARFMCRCPFHEERSPSCAVDERRQTFKCFGCGEGGDVFKYWMLSRSVPFIEAVKALAEMAGTGELPKDAKFVPKARAVSSVPEYPAPLDGRDLERWLEGVEYLATHEEAQREMAEWRGYTMETVGSLARAGMAGAVLSFGVRRWAFPIEALRPAVSIAPPGRAVADGVGPVVSPPANIDASLRDSGEAEPGLERYLAGFHVRLPDRENAEKFRFNYVPSSKQCEERGRAAVGAWPYVIGEPRTCKAVVILEGQWDGIACADALGKVGSRDVAFICVRGATTWRKVLAWTWPVEAQAWLFVDNDESGMRWLHRQEDEPSFAEVVRFRSRALHTFQFQGVKDFNDAHRAEGTGSRAAWQGFFRDCWKRGEKKRRPRRLKTEE